MTTTQFTSLFFVLLTIVSAGRLSLRMNTKVDFLGIASKFSILSGSTITGSGISHVSDSIGVYPGTSITGVINVGGVINAGDYVARNAKNDIYNGFYALKGMAASVNLTGRDLGEMTLVPGVYKFDSSCFLSSILILDAEGNSNAQWIFQIGSTLITTYKSGIKMIGGGNALNVYWQVGSSAIISAETAMCGNIIAYASITIKTSARLQGRALALVGAVTLISNYISLN